MAKQLTSYASPYVLDHRVLYIQGPNTNLRVYIYRGATRVDVEKTVLKAVGVKCIKPKKNKSLGAFIFRTVSR